MLRREITVSFAGKLLQLAQFFCQSHLRDERVDALFDVSTLS
jgi:hypothetical protein